MDYQWYPGHMAQAKRMMQDNVRLVDMIIELVDARAPLATRNPDIGEMGRGKLRIILLNKADLAEQAAGARWIQYFRDQGYEAIEINARSGEGMHTFRSLVKSMCETKQRKDAAKGIVHRPTRAMVTGIPNVGKSTFINTFVGKQAAKTGNKPGVTKGKQWIRMDKYLELLDTPGILWPKQDDPDAARRLAFIGSINDDLLDVVDMAGSELAEIQMRYKDKLFDRYGIEPDEGDPYATLEMIGRSRGCLAKGGTVDLDKTARLFVEDYRSGRLGRITLEFPKEA